MENQDERNFVTFLGHKVRQLRKEQNMTQLDLARQVGITNGQISTIERGVSSPSISTLHRISQVLGVPMSSFFEDEDRVELSILRKGRGRKIAGTDNNVKVEVIAQRGRYGGVNALLVEIGTGELRIAPMPRAGEEYFLYALKGKCLIVVGEESQTVDTGDAAYVKARREQWIRNVGAGSFQGLIISQGAMIGSEIQSLLGAGVS